MYRTHQVESVALIIEVNGQPVALHPAIALVTRKSTEDIILRQTGQVIGNVDYEGVTELYQNMLGCDRRGVAVSTAKAEDMAKEFWEGWQERLIEHRQG